MTSAEVNECKITEVLYIFNGNTLICCSSTALSNQFLGRRNIPLIVKDDQTGIVHLPYQHITLMVI
ncbi:hypothetical protein D3C80_1831720 [compost metagenome]